MAGKREKPEDIVPKLRQVEVLQGQGAAVAEAVRQIGATQPEPTYGTQLQDFMLPGHPAEYSLEITYEELEVALSGGEVASLRKPTYSAGNLGYGPLHPDAMLSPRVAPQMIGPMPWPSDPILGQRHPRPWQTC